MSVRPSRVSRRTLALSCALALVLPVASASAGETDGDDNTLRDRQQQVQGDMNALKDQMSLTSSQLVTAYAALTSAQAKLPGAQARETAATAAVVQAKARDAALAVQLTAATRAAAEAESDLKASRASLDAVSGRMGMVAAEMQDDGSNLGGLSMLVEATTPDDLYSRYSLLDAVGTVQTQSARELATASADATAKQARLEAAQAEVTRLKKESAETVVLQETARRAATQARAEVESLVAQAARAKGQVEARKADEQQRLTELDQEAGALRKELADRAARRRAAAAAAAAERARQASAARAAEARQAAQEAAAAAARKADHESARRHAVDRATDPAPAPAPQPAPPSAPGKGSGFLSYPAVGPITSPFGMRFHPILHVWKLHTGTDFGIGCNAPVYAAADGDVLSAGMTRGDGNRIVVEHGNVEGHDLVTTYNHLSSFVVVGGPVKRGQLLGYSGTTGYSTGCHLHFETIVDGQFQNPMGWL